MTDEEGVANGGSDSQIRQLDRRTIDRIAAGEVVERPASAVKELVENALDADASRVSVAVAAGGIEGIRVTDDGLGMSEGDVRRAIEKHATSKIESIEDLERGVSSLGFRGEALSAIAAVSAVAIRTKPRGGTRGTELVVRGGEVESVSPTGCPAGTAVEVADLFYNVPARKKYLKQPTTEFAHVNRIVTGYALANPAVAVSLEHDGRETFATSGSGELREAVLSTYGRDVASAMISLDGSDDIDGGGSGADGADTEGNSSNGDDTDDEAESPIESIEGLVSDPETTRANASYMTTMVNGRYVTTRTIREAVVDAYGSQLAPDRYPFAVLDISVPARSIDVNVHPRKTEVRFENEQAVKETIERRVRRALLDEGLIRSSAPRGRSAPAQARIDPESHDSESDGADSESKPDSGNRDASTAATERTEATEATEAAGTTRTPAVDEPEPSEDDEGRERSAGSTENDRSQRPQRSQRRSNRDGMGRTERTQTSDRSDATDPERETRETGEAREASRSEPDDISRENGTGVEERRGRGRRGTDRRGTSGSSDAIEAGTPVDLEGVADPHAHIDEWVARSARTERFAAGEQRALLGGSIDDRREFDRLPSLRVLGQFDETYVVAETAEGLVLIDQHAADERVTYERLRERLPRGEAQTLVEPVAIELTAGEAALFDAAIDTLAGLGFYASWAADEGDNGDDENGGKNGDRDRNGTGDEGTNTQRTDVEDTEEPDIEGNDRSGRRTVRVRTVPAALSDPDPELLCDVLAAFVAAERPGETIDAAADALLADLACYPSITAGTSLSAGSMLDLLEALDSCENPYACPHGRPVVIEFSRQEVDARFERDYPGHGGRRNE